MEQVTTIGIDLAKSVFQIHGIDASGGIVPRHFPEERLYQIQGLRNSSVGGFITLVELRQDNQDTVRVDTYVAHDVFRFSSETITQRFFRGLGTCIK